MLIKIDNPGSQGRKGTLKDNWKLEDGWRAIIYIQMISITDTEISKTTSTSVTSSKFSSNFVKIKDNQTQKAPVKKKNSWVK